MGLELAERGVIPEWLIRRSIRRLCERHALQLAAGSDAEAEHALLAFRDEARRGPIAPVPELANDQHYEVPAEFFGEVLGTHRKYSACFWPPGVTDLAVAEAAALRITCERADLRDGMRILELGCGWGSLSLWMASAYPLARIVAISNSVSQRAHIVAQADRRGLKNLEVRTLDMNSFEAFGSFDRVVSVEMFEHMRNWEALLTRVEACLAEEGRVFLHVFCHRRSTYPYRTDGPENWLGRHFFTGGMMPSRDYLRHLEAPLEVEAEWTWNGEHYRRTADAWAANLDRRRDSILRILAKTYGSAEAERWFARWKIFFLACAEMFGLREGTEWMVGHYRLKRPGALQENPRGSIDAVLA
ncbi:MAG: class I SAM-dependent methyltransferase [Candidatus Eisenbacteria bacterium]|uniref:Class I SAM-dependent methyltransferase n=1 Tax=Eiseniibacteriota bacterium TaxID=2212470 RepID=A0A849SGK0_UNCEI|nr:class I SAM-dependent methyltransferase [Candidatus Eisenbacteria bacterium]